ncbi:MAG: urea transporter [Bacteroidetes bacterium]|nr:urea transporter [Bacteroidota bacterium]
MNYKLYIDSIVNSYAQIFFSNHKWFAYLLLIASFIDPYLGVSGLIAAAASVFFAKWMGFNKENIHTGMYSYNSILVGFTIAVFYKMSLPFFGLLLLASLLTMLLSVCLSTFFGAYRIPFLSLPFIFGVWAILQSVGDHGFKAVELSERGIFTINEYYSFWGPEMGEFMADLSKIKFPLLIDVYLKSLGAIFFQNNLLTGILIAVGLIIYSRIAFTLSVLGFLTGYFFVQYFHGNLTELEYSYIGFNYILTSVALGGFFMVPSWRSYVLVMVSSALIALSISALGKFFFVHGLPIYSLPFSIVVMLMIYALNNRYSLNGLNMVQYQLYSPEKNLYTFKNRLERFKNDTYFHIHLPYFGEWFVSQAHEGKITHKEDWRFAFDFVIADETQKTFKSPGEQVTDFYCYNLPVLSPAAGYVVTLVDGIEDNAIGDVNLGENWGNAIVIKHGDFLYSKITHIKQGSFKVKLGDYVKKGDVLASCGNSGRSPEPHIHFQMQSTPFVGAKTLKYPIAYYVSKLNGNFKFHSFDYPLEGQTVFRINTTSLLKNNFDFVPGMTMDFIVDSNGDKSNVKWEVFVDAANQAYIYCHKTQSVAYFINNETLHYFTDFKGDKKSLLYYFYLGAHKILLGYYDQLEVNDVLPIDGFFTGFAKVVQDFAAPFGIYLKTQYTSKFVEIDDHMSPSKIKISSTAMVKIGSSVRRQIDFDFVLNHSKNFTMTINEGKLCTHVIRIA